MTELDDVARETKHDRGGVLSADAWVVTEV